MAPPPNDTTKFELAFLIIWLIVTAALLALTVLRKLTVPNLIKGARTHSIVFAAIQLVIFTLFLAALAENTWSKIETSVFGMSFTVKYGVAGTRVDNGDNTEYPDCTGPQDQKNLCGTIRTAAAFTLVFGLIGIIAAFALLLTVVFTLLAQPHLVRLNAWVPVMSLVQLLCLQACVILWGVSAHDPLRQLGQVDELGASWALAFVSMVLSIVAALFYAGGPGGAAVGSTEGQPAHSAPPTSASHPVDVQPGAPA